MNHHPNQFLRYVKISIYGCVIVGSGVFLAAFHPVEMILHFATLLKTPSQTFSLVDLSVGILASASLCGLLSGLGSLKKLRREIVQRSNAHSDALALARHDALTGLPNRRKFGEDFHTLTSNTQMGRMKAVMMLDIDGFKPINDVYGHAFGDLLLKEFANRLARAVGENGFVARLGGDEFAVVSEDLASTDDVAALARELLITIQVPFVLDSRQVQVGSGIGIALFPQHGFSAAELLRRADIALYRAKTSGRSSYRFFEKEMDADILRRTLLEQRFREALQNDEIHAHFQPILDLNTKEIMGFEALARWKDKDFGDVPPAQFIPIAEDCGLISELTEKLMRQSCRVASSWQNRLFLSFNISPLQLQDHSLPLKVISILAETGLSPDRLVLEITEAALFKNPKAAQVILEQFHQARIKIALDDFGTGFSSLGYLRDLPITKVKIHRSFTANMVQNEESAAIIEAILTLARGLGIETVAEGIEKADVMSLLSKSGCTYGQGFYFGAAKSASCLSDHYKLSSRQKSPLRHLRMTHDPLQKGCSTLNQEETHYSPGTHIPAKVHCI